MGRKGRKVCVVVGCAATVTGVFLTIAAMTQQWTPSSVTVGVGVCIVGVLMIMFGYVIAVTGALNDIYRAGVEEGLAKGRRERLGDPGGVVVEMDRGARHGDRRRGVPAG